MLELTEQQQQDLVTAGWAPCVLNPRTQETFVLIQIELFGRVRAILEEDDGIRDIEEMYPLVNEALDAEDSTCRESA